MTEGHYPRLQSVLVSAHLEQLQCLDPNIKLCLPSSIYINAANSVKPRFIEYPNTTVNVVL